MPVNLQAPSSEQLHPVNGLDIGVAMAGVRKANRRDLVLFQLAAGSAVAGVFTQNRFCAAPVQVCREHLSAGVGIRALLINTGNANAGTGDDGLVRARTSCIALAQKLDLAPEQVLPFSTGVIMETLPVDRIIAGLPAALADAAPDHWLEAAQGIMTTDTLPKAASRQLQIGGHAVTVTGIAKGAGMIRPNMATMLGFVATDAVIAPALMQALARDAEHRFAQQRAVGRFELRDARVAGALRGDQHERIIRAGVAVDGDAVEALVGRFAHQRLHQRRLDHRVGGDEAEQGGHVRADHAGALGDAGDGDAVPADQHLARGGLGQRVGGHDAGCGLAPMRRRQAGQRRGQAGLDALYRQRLHDYAGGERQHLLG